MKRWISGRQGVSQRVAFSVLLLAIAHGGLPTSLAAPRGWAAAAPEAAKMEQLAREDPVAFLKSCLDHYGHEVKGYHAVMQKQERIQGRLQPKEIIDVCFKDNPHSVCLRWIEGARKAERALYVEGANNGKMLARPSGILARKIAGDVVERDVDSDDARQSGRYTLNQYGIRKGSERTLAAWIAAQQAGALHVAYLGEQRVKEVGDRSCYKLRRTYDRPEQDGVTEITIYVDRENWLQVGSVLKGAGGKIIGEYFFRDIQLNPEFSPQQFQREALLP